MYKTFQSTCIDLNHKASILNTQSLQKLNANGDLVGEFNVSTTNLSLIVAAGFQKGEIHVFDLFKNEASVFYNNSKLVDKSKVTCIKWLPNSVNLFLVGYSSGSIYLYDANDQTQPLVAPNFSKLCQNDSFSIYINNESSSLSSNFSNQKLLLSNSSQTSQMAKNPLLKLAISTEQNSAYGVNGVNDLAFSPCGQYIAVAGQDGLLRVFRFEYQNNQQMQIQLRCSMKSYFGGLLCVSWSPDGKYIATGGEDDAITIFSFIEMRVVCRGRGHSSWINCVQFDPWTTLLDFTNNNSYINLMKKNKLSLKNDSNRDSQTQNKAELNQDDDSDVEEFHNKSGNNSTGSGCNINKNSLNLSDEKKLEILDSEKRAKISAGPKKRTISTLSDFNNSANSNQNAFLLNNNNNVNNLTSLDAAASSFYYRLASIGQDNQICFWDLTEDVLKEKAHNAGHSALQHSRSRVSSSMTNQYYSSSNGVHNPNTLSQIQNLPQVIIQPSDSLVNDELINTNTTNSNNSSTNSGKQHHSTASSIVSSAKHLFSSKNSDKSEKSLK
jgi:hypothetical protein